MTTPAPRGARGGYAKGKARREAIIQAAIVQFGETGFHGASLRDIAARAEITHPGLLHHFPSKADLLEAVLEHRDEVDTEDIAADQEQGRDWLEAVMRLAGRNQRRRPVVELYAVLAAESTSPEHPAHEYFVERYESTLRAATEAFVARAEAGGLRDGVDPASAARGFIATMDGLQIQWLLARAKRGPGVVDMEAELRAYVAALG